MSKAFFHCLELIAASTAFNDSLNKNIQLELFYERPNFYTVTAQSGFSKPTFKFCYNKSNLKESWSSIEKSHDKKDEYVSVGAREAVRLLSICHGQDYLKCNCTGNCATKRCSCKKANLKCSSKCHGKEFKCANCE
ncbi:KRAB-A domain-containing 2-like [Brachionus plicatilis]|uniref:KRAB-A domain-containing 2-like n=1 Tax=Brachionus plicatilis TaxID=10195 RepID=A0A3M7QC71_BRAPC|nr:KRAB-A domain-containing 2-like [Brachionus plicatilis]